MIKPIPLNKLLPSARNVRRASDPQADAELLADIEARGLLQNLIVTAVKKPRGSFAVEGGGRRLDALTRLAEGGKLAKNFEVPCLVLDDIGTNAVEASLAENFQRLALNPCDECLAFRHFIEQGSDVEGVARRFGLTVRFVEGRLRLAGLAPQVFDALGRGEITLDIAKAYASTPDQERQAQVFEQMSNGYGAAHPDSIRRMMMQATVPAGDPRARFVGEDAYLAAGGRIDRDLFDDETSSRWLDVALLERLASEKLEAQAEALREEQGFAWVRPTLDRHLSYYATEGLRRVPLDKPLPTDDERQELDRLEGAYAGAVAVLEDEASEDEARVAAEASLASIESAIEAIIQKPPMLHAELRDRVGTFLLLGADGQPVQHEAYYLAVDAVPDDAVGSAEEDSGQNSNTVEPKFAGLSQRLTDELAIQRRDILAVHVSADPAFALDLAIFLMADGGYEAKGSSLSAAPPADPVFGFRTPNALATIARSEAEASLDRSWQEGKTLAERFDAFRALEPDRRYAWLGHVVAGSLKASSALPGPLHCEFHDHLAGLLSVEVAAWWRPTASNYFDRVTRGAMLETLTEIEGPALAARYASGKKAELAAACERICSGDFIGEVGTKEAARGWAPGAMRFATLDRVTPEREHVAEEARESSEVERAEDREAA